jgi:20S proteasome subunit alpha 7
MHSHTLYWMYRPFGCGVIVGNMEKDKAPSLHMMDPSGTCYEFYHCAMGKGKQVANTEMDKIDLKNINCADAVYTMAKILHKSHEESREKKYELEMTWICPQSGFAHQHVPKELLKEASARAQKDIENEMIA